MLEFNKRAIELGLSIICLKPKSKAPIVNDWTNLPNQSYDELKADYRAGQNLGVRLGKPSKLANDDYAHVLDVDFDSDNPDDIEDCYQELDKILPDWDKFPMVQSGSGGKARHIYITSDEPLPSCKIARSKRNVEIDGKKKAAWQIDLYGTKKQVVFPPSIHPDTGREYKWLKPLDWDRIALRLRSSYFVKSSQIAAWGAKKAEKPRDDEDAFDKAVHSGPLDLPVSELKDDMRHLPADWVHDYDTWLKVGQALHHEYHGDDDGLELWHWYSDVDGANYEPDVLDRKWESFRDKRDGVTWRSIKLEANKGRKDEAADEIADAQLQDLGDYADADEKEKKKAARAWLRTLDQTANGDYHKTLNNIVAILRNDLHWKNVICQNVFFNKIVIRRDMKSLTPNMLAIRCKDTVNGDQWRDIHDTSLRSFLEASRKQGGYGMSNIADRDLVAAVGLVAEHNEFHPVKEYLEGLVWDDKHRKDYLWIDYLGAPDDAYHREIAEKFTISAVARIYEPGMKFDFVPIFTGFQGKRKTSFIEALAVNAEWFGGLNVNFRDPRSMIMSMMGKWILEIPELAGFNRQDVAHIKAFISAGKDNTRLPWGRRNEDFKRNSVLMGTTNDSKYLLDETGNRRYWPVTTDVDSIDIEKLTGEVNQIWAEAYHEYVELRKKHPGLRYLPLYLQSPEAVAISQAKQNEAMEDTTSQMWAERITEWLNQPIEGRSGFDNLEGPTIREEVTLREVWTECFGKEEEDYVREVPKILGAAMRLVEGWEDLGPRKTANRAKTVRVFRRKKKLPKKSLI